MADILSRNPAGLTPQKIKTATRPKEIMISAIDVNPDPTLKEKLKNTARYHSNYLQTQKIKDDLKAAQPTTADGYKLLK